MKRGQLQNQESVQNRGRPLLVRWHTLLGSSIKTMCGYFLTVWQHWNENWTRTVIPPSYVASCNVLDDGTVNIVFVSTVSMETMDYLSGCRHFIDSETLKICCVACAFCFTLWLEG